MNNPLIEITSYTYTYEDKLNWFHTNITLIQLRANYELRKTKNLYTTNNKFITRSMCMFTHEYSNNIRLTFIVFIVLFVHILKDFNSIFQGCVFVHLNKETRYEKAFKIRYILKKNIFLIFWRFQHRWQNYMLIHFYVNTKSNGHHYC